VKNLLTVGTCTVLFCFGLWPIALLFVFVVSYHELIEEQRRLDEEPIVYPTFEQKQLMAIVAAHEAGQFEKAALLERKFQQEW
jgi:hypothetical protein